MRYFLSTKLVPNYDGYYANFQHKKQQNTDAQYCDIRSYIKLNQKRWLNSLEEWHSQLCEVGSKITPYWWLIDGSRFYTFSPPIYSPFIFAVALNKYCIDHNIKYIALLDCPKEVYKYLKEMDSCAEFIFQNNHKFELLNKAIYWHRILRNILRLIINLLNSFRYIMVFSYKTNDERIIVFSQIFDSIEEKNNTDHYFGNIFDQYETKHKNHILWVYQYNLNFRSNKSFENKTILNKKNYRIIQQLNNPLDIFNILLIYLKLINSYRRIGKHLPLIAIEGIKSQVLPKEYFSFLVNGILPLNELLIYNAFKKIIKYNNKIDTIVYPYEEKALERAILLSAKKIRKNITTIGYSHTVHWNLHYWYHIRPNSLSNPPRPNILSVTGALEKWWLNNIAEVPEVKIKVLGSNRYVDNKYPVPKCCYDFNNMKVLIVVGYSCDMNILANYLEDEPEIFDQCDLLIRKYPFSWEKEQNIGISRINNFVDSIRVNNDEPLETQIKWCDITIYNTSSCGIIAMLSGRIAINVAMHDIFYWDPLEKDDSKNAVIHCRSAFELKNSINQLKGINSKKYTEIQEKQYYYAKNIYGPINNGVLNDLLNLRKI